VKELWGVRAGGRQAAGRKFWGAEGLRGGNDMGR
jgi:hypothetical protein